MATYKSINKALEKAGYEVELVKGCGYMYFQDYSADYAFSDIPSIYQNGLGKITAAQIVQHVELYMEK